MIWEFGNTPTQLVLLTKLATSTFSLHFLDFFFWRKIFSYQAKNQPCDPFNTCGTCPPSGNCTVVAPYMKFTVGDYGEARGADQIKSEVCSLMFSLSFWNFLFNFIWRFTNVDLSLAASWRLLVWKLTLVEFTRNATMYCCFSFTFLFWHFFSTLSPTTLSALLGMALACWTEWILLIGLFVTHGVLRGERMVSSALSWTTALVLMATLGLRSTAIGEVWWYFLFIFSFLIFLFLFHQFLLLGKRNFNLE